MQVIASARVASGAITLLHFCANVIDFALFGWFAICFVAFFKSMMKKEICSISITYSVLIININLGPNICLTFNFIYFY